MIPDEIKSLLSVDIAWHYGIVPFKKEGAIMHLQIAEDKASPTLVSELEVVLGNSVELVFTEKTTLQKLLLETYPRNAKAHESQQNVFTTSKISDLNFVEALISEAQQLRSSDIHIETYGDTCRIRFRVDGNLIERHRLGKNEYPGLINKVKIAAKCDIAERRLPQDGRIRQKLNSQNIDLRVSILPTLHGEKIVLRLLGSDASHIALTTIGLPDKELEIYQSAITKPHGIILISGPTGSGKTTTLYATLKELNKSTNNILTVEDPVEYTLDGINQVHLREDIGLDYSKALRTFLRQDPDIIMLGEIRDPETAKMAVRAALTGHLVLSTIHTNSAWGTISRLVEMGVPAYLVLSVLNISVAQRLVRSLCESCKQIAEFDPKLFPKKYQNRAPKNHYVICGCSACFFSGYKGRIALYEIIEIDQELRKLIKDNSDNPWHYLEDKGFKSIADNAIEAFLLGKTSLEEIYPYLVHES